MDAATVFAARREAVAEAVRREGEADASAILARGEAEAEARERNAEAFKQYNEAAVLQLLAGVVPDIVRAASEPLGQIDRMTVISTDGASQLARSVATNVEQGLQIGSELMGLDLRAVLARLGGTADGGDGTVAGPVRPDAGGDGVA